MIPKDKKAWIVACGQLLEYYESWVCALEGQTGYDCIECPLCVLAKEIYSLLPEERKFNTTYGFCDTCIWIHVMGKRCSDWADENKFEVSVDYMRTSPGEHLGWASMRIKMLDEWMDGLR